MARTTGHLDEAIEIRMREVECLLARYKKNYTFDERTRSLTATLREQMAEGERLDAIIDANLKERGHGG